MKRLSIFRSGLLAALGALGLFAFMPLLSAQDEAQKKADEQPTAQAQEKADPIPPTILENDDAPIVKGRKRRAVFAAHGQELVRVGDDAQLAKGERASQVVVVMGDAVVDGDVDRDVVVVGGHLTLNGKVGHDVVVVLGSATLGPQAEIGHDIVTVAGTLTRPKDAQIGGRAVTVPFFPGIHNLNTTPRWLKSGLLLARPLPPGIQAAWIVAGGFLLLYLLTALILPRPVQASLDILAQRPVAAFFTGILGFILCGPAMFLLAVSVIGLVVIPFVVCALVVAAIIGKASVLRFLGLQVARQTKISILETALFSLLLGAVLVALLYTVPVVGFVTWGILTPLGFGATLLAAFGTVKKEQAPPAPIQFATSTTAGAAPFGVPPADAGVIAPPPVFAPEMVTLPRVGFWMRFLATLLDFILVGWLVAVNGPFFIIFWGAYHIAMWTWKGTTIGGIVLGLKVIRTDGRPVDFAVALVRFLSGIFSFMVLCLGFFWAGWTRERQSWHDKIAGTVIVRVSKNVSLI